jgi:hypothetical protein
MVSMSPGDMLRYKILNMHHECMLHQMLRPCDAKSKFQEHQFLSGDKHNVNYSVLILPINLGRAIAQAVSRWLPTAAARVRTRVWQVGFVVDKVALGQVFSDYFGFPCQSSFHQILHHHTHPGHVQ